ncbi:MAG: D-2-hydroxyacid dehydrogenase family protein [Dehalococcoidia bacterium]|nr:MAG: D-2-hydroxyacid dehydrogenase family protein [Dehalococcoidia bacterium]
MKIAVIDDYQGVFRELSNFHRLSGHEVVTFSEPERDMNRLAEWLREFDAVVLTQERTRFRRGLIERLPNLRLISMTGGTAAIDLDACTERGIVVSAGGGRGSPNETAELTWALILASLRHLPFEVEQLKRGAWQTTLGTSLTGRTLGIYALGKIGSVVATVGKAFGMDVVCWGREGSLGRAREAGYEVAASRAALFQTVDVLSIHLPLNGETRGIITADDLARMKSTALLVNTSRAPIIAEGALAEALRRGRPGFAAVDVYEDEPVLGGEHPLLKMANVIATPHLGYVTRDRYESMYGATIEHILAFANGSPILVANPAVLTKG